MDSEFYEAAKVSISRVVGHYNRRYSWTDASDLAQEAWVAVIDAEQRYDPERGDMRGYCYQIAKYALRPLMLRSSAIVSAPRNDRGSLMSFHYSASYCGIIEEKYELFASGTDTAAAIDRKRWADDIAKQLAQVFNAIDGGEIAQSCIVEERKASEVAAAFGVPVAAVYDVTRKARRAVEHDRELFRLWRRDDRNEN